MWDLPSGPRVSLASQLPAAPPVLGMGGLAIGLVVVGSLLLLALLWVAAIYNRLATRRIRVRNAFAQIDVQLRRRHDLIPNLVNTVKGYMAHERQTLEAVTQARAAAVSAVDRVAGSPADAGATIALAQAEDALQGALGKLLILMERYPDIKANTNALALQEELVTTENRVAFARQAYNDAVMTYNTSLSVFPDNLVAGAFRFQQSALFEAEADARALPSVEFQSASTR